MLLFPTVQRHRYFRIKQRLAGAAAQAAKLALLAFALAAAVALACNRARGAAVAPPLALDSAAATLLASSLCAFCWLMAAAALEVVFTERLRPDDYSDRDVLAAMAASLAGKRGDLMQGLALHDARWADPGVGSSRAAPGPGLAGSSTQRPLHQPCSRLRRPAALPAGRTGPLRPERPGLVQHPPNHSHISNTHTVPPSPRAACWPATWARRPCAAPSCLPMKRAISGGMWRVRGAGQRCVRPCSTASVHRRCRVSADLLAAAKMTSLPAVCLAPHPHRCLYISPACMQPMLPRLSLPAGSLLCFAWARQAVCPAAPQSVLLAVQASFRLSDPPAAACIAELDALAAAVAAGVAQQTSAGAAGGAPSTATQSRKWNALPSALAPKVRCPRACFPCDGRSGACDGVHAFALCCAHGSDTVPRLCWWPLAMGSLASSKRVQS